ncbi:MAG: nucleotidyltransferase domain-containing protein [Pseudomonadota bacterium]
MTSSEPGAGTGAPPWAPALLTTPDPRGEAASYAAGCRNWYETARSALIERFDRGEAVESLVRQHAALVDSLLIRIWTDFGLHVHPELVLVAVGGYGRGELHPYSDVDLMVLVDGDVERHGEVASEFVTLLWDLRIDVGHSVRTVAQCVEQARQDITVASNLSEARLLFGAAEVYEMMRSQVAPTWSSAAFFEAKREEQMTRHRRYHDTA